ncbi:MAG TPA: LysR family transcriptional regulator [Burkholderiaceae bacterium]|nr:LysR family transcriptional regulator [Burkholderiaceae bacterium]
MESKRLRRYLRHGMLPQLAAFDAVMRLGSVTQASAALHMAQPTVSGHLRKLSEAVGVPLFRCDGRRMLPTAPARALHEGTLGVFAALHDLDCALEPLRGGQTSTGARLVAGDPNRCGVFG